jgi:hypothetical protein
MLRTGKLVWGCILVIAGLLLFTQDMAAFGVILLIIGIPLSLVGLAAGRKAGRFNRQDTAVAERIGEELWHMLQRPALSAYAPDSQGWEIQDARVVELQRHFDQETAGNLDGALHHNFSSFSSSFGLSLGRGGQNWFGAASAGKTTGLLTGISNVSLTMRSTTRDNLMGDALFSVLEFPTAKGEFDTMRLISMSQPGAAAWIGDLVNAVGVNLGGHSTHSGGTVLRHLPDLVNHFTPKDVSYTTDRLKALERRHHDAGSVPTLHAFGQPIGRNAMIATEIRFADGQRSHLFPLEFPRMLGDAVGRASSSALESLSETAQKAVAQN